MSREEDFQVDANASFTVPTQASALRVGGYIVIHDAPCKITHMSSAKTGKHGGAKISIMAIDIFTEKKHETHFMSTENVDVPIVTKQEYQLINIDDEGFMSMLTDNSQVREDIRLPDGELGQQIQESFDEGNDLMIATIKAMGKEQPTGFSVKK